MTATGLTPRTGGQIFGGVPTEVLLVEDDDGDAFLVDELLESEDGIDLILSRARSLAEAVSACRHHAAACILLDLGLPDGLGLESIETLAEAAPRSAIIVLTGRSEREVGIEAVAAGAQDYLMKAELSAPVLVRSIRYAIARKQADLAAHRLAHAESLRQANNRLERGLLPRPILRDPAIQCASRYLPSADFAVLGGDFFDAVELDDGRLRVIVGDVAGHGPDEAALGVSLRIAWRALALTGTDESAVLPALEQIVLSERTDEQFATACDLTISADRRSLSLRLAGHPPPIALLPTPTPAPSEHRHLPLAVMAPGEWPSASMALPEEWALLLFTDGLIEGTVGSSGDRLGLDGLLRLVRILDIAIDQPARLANAVLDRATDLNGGRLPDDVAVVVLAHADDSSA